LQVHEAWCSVERAISSSITRVKDNSDPSARGDWKV